MTQTLLFVLIMTLNGVDEVQSPPVEIGVCQNMMRNSAPSTKPRCENAEKYTHRLVTR